MEFEGQYNIKLADFLDTHMERAGYTNGRLAREINARYGKHLVHRSNIRNWRTGTSKSVRDWRQMVAICAVLNLSREQTNRLLEAAALPGVEELWTYKPDDDACQFLSTWVSSPVERDSLPESNTSSKALSPGLNLAKGDRRYRRLFSGVIVFLAVVIGLAWMIGAQETAVSLCGETERVEDSPEGKRFLPDQGVTVYTQENTPGGLLNNRVRAVEGTSKGVIIGYFGKSAASTNGLSYFDRNGETKLWANCNHGGAIADQLVNAILVHQEGNIVVATDGGGIVMFDGYRWHSYTMAAQKIDSDAVYQLVEDRGQLWAATGEGVSRFNGERWSLEFDDKAELYHNQVYDVAFDSNNNIWVGHINKGISLYRSSVASWQHIEAEEGPGGEQIRGIVIQEADGTSPQSVWIGTAASGVSRLTEGEWVTYGVDDGLPSLNVQTVTKDRYNRVWVGTDQGTVYFDGTHWARYHDLNTLSIDFSPGCLEDSCPRDDHVWTGTDGWGLTHSRLPYPDTAVEVTQICLRTAGGRLDCPALAETEKPHVITATYPIALKPGESFHFEIEVTPQPGYELREDRGDFLSYSGRNRQHLFSAFERIPVAGTIVTGEFFVFSNRNNMFVAPEISTGNREETFVSSWRIWMHTRYAGPEIRIVFTVEQPRHSILE